MTTATQESVDGKVLRMLMDPRWHFMSVPGISEELGISREETQTALARNPLQVREVGVRNRNGDALYYHSEKPKGRIYAFLYLLKVYLNPDAD